MKALSPPLRRSMRASTAFATSTGETLRRRIRSASSQAGILHKVSSFIVRLQTNTNRLQCCMSPFIGLCQYDNWLVNGRDWGEREGSATVSFCRGDEGGPDLAGRHCSVARGL